MTGTHQNTASDNAPVAEVRISLPTVNLFVWVIASVLLVACTWAAAVALGPWTNSDFSAGMAGVLVAGIVAIAGILIITPWKKRAIADWMTMWLAGTVFRVLATPVAAFLLYSAASSSLAAKPFGLAVALTYIATLFVEAAVLAQYMKAVSDRHESISRDHPSR